MKVLKNRLMISTRLESEELKNDTFV